MNEDHVRNVVEAALLAAGRPLGLAELAQLFDEDARPAPAALREALGRIADDHAARALELREVASGWRLQVRAEFAPEVSRLWPERPQRYSRALLETLALIAYRQPITRAEIEAVRGVAVNPNIVKTLMERNWVRVVGHRDVPGHPELLGTTKDFLDHFGLADLDELPPLAELKALADLNPQLSLPVGSEGEEAVLVPDTAPAAGEVPADPSSDASSDAAADGAAGEPPPGDAGRP
jgi:segregation and condensation protein B